MTVEFPSEGFEDNHLIVQYDLAVSRGVKAKKFLTRFNTNGTVKLRVKNARVKTVCVNWC